ncbi:hypothetical protein EVG20_g4398 [Dentipellis fragilis]|uniref:Uncharacterized protein n=1 Tax=Dentipellis fragilis TaxID=205917 RepID=A0A4Y9YY53_9AGAM|nr:hypothetical protein EVG20_g4398 [Dentipellis fragilis]
MRPPLRQLRPHRPPHYFTSRSVSNTPARHATEASVAGTPGPPPPGHTKSQSQRLEHAPAITTLHTARQLLPRIIAPGSQELAFWKDVLSRTAEELAGTSASKARNISVVVYPVDDLASADARALVSALLEDPFADKAQAETVKNRWKDRDQHSQLDIEYETKEDPSNPSLLLQSSFLTSLPLPLRVTELSLSRSTDDLRTLSIADIPIVVVNPVSTSLRDLLEAKSSLLPFPLPPHTLVVLSTASPTSISSSAFPNSITAGPNTPHILPLDPSRALTALDAFRASPSSPLHIQRYQDDMIASNLPALRTVLSAPVDFRAHKAKALLQAYTSVLNTSLEDAKSEVANARATIHSLLGEAVGAREAALDDVFGVIPSESEAVVHASLNLRDPVRDVNEDKVRVGFQRVGAVLKPYIHGSGLSWWSVLWRADEVGWGTTLFVRRSYSRPSNRRRAMLEGVVTDTLERAAQGLIARVFGSASAGVGVGGAWIAWQEGAAWLVGSAGDAAVSAAQMAEAVGTGTGLGLLVAVSGIRWAVGKWEHARRDWWMSWKRVADGAERDMRTSLEEALEKKVVIVPVRASEGLEDIVGKRSAEVDSLCAEVKVIEEAVRALEPHQRNGLSDNSTVL